MNRDKFVQKIAKELRSVVAKQEYIISQEQLVQLQAEHLADLFLPEDDEPWFDLISLHNGVILKTHPPTACAGDYCPVHNPSDHHMDSWPQVWDAIHGVMRRVCEHDQSHPDPDDLHVRARPDRYFESDCDGCCDPNFTPDRTQTG